MLSPSDIRSAVADILSAADIHLCSYQILDRLPNGLRDLIIQERGFPGAGSGNSYSSASLVTDAVELVLPSLEPPYRIYIATGGTTYSVGGHTLTAGNQAIAFYRLNANQASAATISTNTPQTANNIAPPVITNLKVPSTMLLKPWFEKAGCLITSLIFFFPAFIYGIWKNKVISKSLKWVLIAPFIIIATLSVMIPGKYNTENESESVIDSSKSEAEAIKQAGEFLFPDAKNTKKDEKSTNTDEWKNNGLVLKLKTLKCVRGEFGNVKITGEIVNRTDRKLGYAQVNFNLLDKNKNQVGTALANTNNLDPNRTWKFEATAFNDKFESAEPAELTGF